MGAVADLLECGPPPFRLGGDLRTSGPETVIGRVDEPGDLVRRLQAGLEELGSARQNRAARAAGRRLDLEPRVESVSETVAQEVDPECRDEDLTPTLHRAASP